MPRKITTYEFDLDKANSDPNALAADLITKVHELPDKEKVISSLRPQDLYAFITKINNTESVAVSYNNAMCPTKFVEQSCAIDKCDEVCRNTLACRLGNASQLNILDCTNKGLLDPDYGMEYLLSVS